MYKCKKTKKTYHVYTFRVRNRGLRAAYASSEEEAREALSHLDITDLVYKD